MLLRNDELFRAELENLELNSPEMLPSTIEEIRVSTKGDLTLSVLCEFMAQDGRLTNPVFQQGPPVLPIAR